MKRLKLILTMLFSIPFTVLFTGALLFLPAGDYYWFQGWMLIASLIFYILLVFIYFIVKDPSTLEKRSKISGEKGDALYLILMGIIFLTVILLPAFDYRYGWSQLPLFFSWLGFAGLIITYIIILMVMRENSFASKGLMIHEGQSVIQTGPYSVVRHPMYSGSIIMCVSIPLTLGSLISLIPAIFIPVVLGFRIGKEEAMLIRELEGYEEYRRKIRYRLIPGIW